MEWVLLFGLVAASTPLALAILGGEWLTAVDLLLNPLVFSMLPGMSRRPQVP